MISDNYEKDIFLQPGELHFGQHDTRIRTLLGSCIAITLWHPAKRIGGMCHYMLPEKLSTNTSALDGRYAKDVLQLFMKELEKNGTFPYQYEVKIIGGGSQFPSQGESGVPDRNIDIGRQLLAKYGFSIKVEHLGGQGHRSVIFDVSNGDVWIKHVEERLDISY